MRDVVPSCWGLQAQWRGTPGASAHQHIYDTETQKPCKGTCLAALVCSRALGVCASVRSAVHRSPWLLEVHHPPAPILPASSRSCACSSSTTGWQALRPGMFQGGFARGRTDLGSAPCSGLCGAPVLMPSSPEPAAGIARTVARAWLCPHLPFPAVPHVVSSTGASAPTKTACCPSCALGSVGHVCRSLESPDGLFEK